jgi:toxin ParE1/3/4
MPTAFTTTRARQDLIDILNYLDRHSVAAADRFADQFDRQARLLARFPKMGASKEKLFPEMRSSVVGKYILFYRPCPNGIEILRVLHGSRNFSNIDWE